MSGERYIKQAIIAALCEHPEQDKYQKRAFAGDNLQRMLETMRAGMSQLTKADFFTPDDEGRYIIETPGMWRNFEKIRDIIHANGGRFRMEDFLLPLGRSGDSRTLLENASDSNALAKIFTAEVWKGNFDEMERLWYYVPMMPRSNTFGNDGMLGVALRREMFASEGRDLPEDRLAKAGVTPADLKFTDPGNFDALVEKLSRAGDWIRKEYLFLPDKLGYTMFDHDKLWDRYDQIAKGLRANGEAMEVPDFLRRMGRVHSPLRRAGELGKLDKIFRGEHWAGRLDEMMVLWSHVLPGWKTGTLSPAEFDRCYVQAEHLTYGALVDVKNISGKDDLLVSLNGADSKTPVLPLGLRTVWENFADIERQLSAKGQKIAMSDLRRKSGHMSDSCLISAAKFGNFTDVCAIAKKSGEPLTLDDFLSRDSHNKTLLDILADGNELAKAFMPELWAGRVDEMKALWQRVRITDRVQVDFPRVEVETKHATLKSQSKRGNFKL